MTATTQDLTIEQGATFDDTWTWTDSNGDPVNLTGYTARAQVRSQVTSSSTVVSVTSGNGLTLGGVAGTIRMQLSAATTAALTAPFSGVWDLEVESSGGVVTRLFSGTVTVTAEVTR